MSGLFMHCNIGLKTTRRNTHCTKLTKLKFRVCSQKGPECGLAGSKLRPDSRIKLPPTTFLFAKYFFLVFPYIVIVFPLLTCNLLKRFYIDCYVSLLPHLRQNYPLTRRWWAYYTIFLIHMKIHIKMHYEPLCTLPHPAQGTGWGYYSTACSNVLPFVTLQTFWKKRKLSLQM